MFGLVLRTSGLGGGGKNHAARPITRVSSNFFKCFLQSLELCSSIFEKLVDLAGSVFLFLPRDIDQADVPAHDNLIKIVSRLQKTMMGEIGRASCRERV